MADIFISYSSKDREKAEQLTELLASAGLSVWIDKHGIGAATSWSKEIVDAIDRCKAMVVLLSSSSVVSENVMKEVSLAAERKKKILPLDLEPVPIPNEMAYHLAGLQRAPMTNIDAIIRAIGKIGLEATQPPILKLVKETDGRKSLMILPFEDLSPTGDNGWFADGIASELISALSNVKSLKISDNQATKEFKSYHGQLTTYAREMQIRYFVQGDVRKFGDNIKITARLLDIETGDHLWQDSIKGAMSDVFEIQEQVAGKVVDGLKLHLTSREKQKLAERGTENTDAYELYLKANEYFLRNTREGFQLASQLCTEAIALDPDYANAYQFKANALANLYRTYDRNPALLDEAETLAKEALRLKPDMVTTYNPLSVIYILQGRLAEAEETAMEYIRKAPEDYSSYFALGYFFMETGDNLKAISPFEEAVRLKPDYRGSLFNLVALYNDAAISTHDRSFAEKRMTYARVALQLEERHLKLHPDDEGCRQNYALLLFWNGRASDALKVAQELKNARDGKSLFNIAGLFNMLGESDEALTTFRKAIEAGYKNIRLLNAFLMDENEGVARFAGTPEYEEVKRMIEEIQRETEARKNG